MTRRRGICLAAASILLAAWAPAVPSAAAKFRRHGVADAPAKAPGTIRLATYNIHSLYDDADDPALVGKDDDAGRTIPENRRVAVADALRRIAADVVAVQEVESLAALEWFRDRHLTGLGYDHAAAIEVGHAIGLEQGVLSRYPIVESRVWVDRPIGVHPPTYRGEPNRYAGQPLYFRRSPLLVELDLPGQPAAEAPEANRLTLLVVHLKTGSGSAEWRAAEAAALVEIVGELVAERPGRRVMLAGDFVGEAGSPALQTLLGAGFVDAFAGLDRPADEIATDVDGRRECFVLANPAAAALLEGGERFVLGTVAPPPGVRLDVAFGMPGFASDHYPVVVDLSASE